MAIREDKKNSLERTSIEDKVRRPNRCSNQKVSPKGEQYAEDSS